MLQGLLAVVADLAIFNALSRWWSMLGTIVLLALVLVVAVITR